MSGKKRSTNLEKLQQQKPFSPVRMLLVQVALMNVFLIVCCYLEIVLTAMLRAFFEANVLKEVPISCVISTVTVRYYYQSSKIKLIILFLTSDYASPKLSLIL